ncbi:nitrate transporter [Ralstonia solanacearum]|nr:nitrate transporter [Ralstonia solanacearum]
MGYLFQNIIESSLRQAAEEESTSKRAKAEHVRKLVQTTADTLFSTNQRIVNSEDDYDVAKQLALTMGAKYKQGTQPHAGDRQYVGDEWRVVSDNYEIITSMVIAELHQAYQLGLDIRAPNVIGKMFYLAVQVWSELGDYTGNAQDEIRR